MTLEENLNTWTGHDWSQGGEEWSKDWGGSRAQWFWTILPRIQQFLPAETVLEIAPGHGRWTEHLLRHAEMLIGIDIVESCVDACRSRFSHTGKAAFFLNDGKSLDCIADHSIDFAFSFDSLVHADVDVMEAYVKQLAVKLRRGGSAFLHHSNGGAYDNPGGGRDEGMTAEKFIDLCDAAGLCCPFQELVPWHSGQLTDCFSTVVTELHTPTIVFPNGEFPTERRRACV